MRAMFGAKLKGEYRLEVRREGKLIKETDWFDNLVLNTGLNRLPSGSAVTVCRLGTGSSTPTESQTSLDSQIASTTSYSLSSSTNKGAPYYQAEHTMAYSFSQGAVVGNITEIGVGWGTTSGTLFSRALILDTNGNPTSITLTSIDQLTVYYKISVYPTLADTTGSFVINGTTYTYVSRPAGVSGFGNTAGLIRDGSLLSAYYIGSYRATPNYPVIGGYTSNITGTVDQSWFPGIGHNNVSVGASTYINDSFYLDHTWYANINGLNSAGGIAAFNIGYAFNTVSYQIVLNQAIPKDNTKTFSITTRINWGRT